jgi:hypothetical protein
MNTATLVTPTGFLPAVFIVEEALAAVDRVALFHLNPRIDVERANAAGPGGVFDEGFSLVDLAPDNLRVFALRDARAEMVAAAERGDLATAKRIAREADKTLENLAITSFFAEGGGDDD